MKTTIKFRLSLVLVLILVLLSTSIYAISLPNKVLPYMSRGQDVIEVQKALDLLGFDLSIDGIYGPGTKNAMMKFQQNHGEISDDGIYGPATKEILQIALDSNTEGDNNTGGNDNNTDIGGTNLPNTVLPFMSRGEGVKQVQKALNNVGYHLTVDGVYGQDTRDAMKSFQENYGELSNDGIYGPATKKILQIVLDGNAEGDPPPVDPPTETGKVAYLTFDDGPSSNITPRILDILDDYAIKATFFMLGNEANQNPNMVKRVHNSGHSIGNHSYSHNYDYIYANINNFLGEVYNTQSTFKNILGQNFSSRLLRFPGGSFEGYKDPYRQAVKDIGFDYYDWNALNGDAEGVNIPAASLVSRLKETVRGQDELIVLMHDSASKSTTADALPEIIDYLKAQGYSFDKLSE